MSEAIFQTIEGRRRTVHTRSPRPLASRERILDRCRELMLAGNLRPRTDEISVGIITPPAIHAHFETISMLYQATLAYRDTRDRVLAMLMPNGPMPASDDCDRVLRAIIKGVLPS